MLIDCKECKGTGLYVGFAEHKGSAVVCYHCKGAGAVEFKAPPEFSGRKRRAGITSVSRPGSGWNLVPGRDLGAVTYEEFLAGKLPGEFLLNPEFVAEN